MQRKHSKPVIGLMGAPASGKTFVAHLFEDAGCGVVDADALAREATSSPELIDAARTRWGSGVVTEAGVLDRTAVAARVFADDGELRWLESQTHPRVAEQRALLHEKWLRNADIKAVVEDCPLLLETGLDKQCDVLIYVDAPLDVRRERVARTRGWDAAELQRREDRQTSLDTKRAAADYVISTAGDPDTVARSVADVLSQVLSGNQTTSPD